MKAGRIATLAAAAVVVAVVVSGCGSTATSSSGSPTPAASGSGAASNLAGVRAYLDSLKPILSQLGKTASTLDDAVKGISKKPDATWTTAATKLDTAAGELGSEATSLSALTPPAVLQPLQDAAVQGIQSAQRAVSKSADALDKRAATSATRRAQIQAQIAGLAAGLSTLSRQLLGAAQDIVGSATTAP